LGLIGWRITQRYSAATGQLQTPQGGARTPPTVSVAPVQIRTVAVTFEATASLEAPLDVKLAPKITGRIAYLQAREGDQVRKGQVLVRIDASDVEAGVNQARANVAEAQYRLAQAQITENPTNVGIASQIHQQEASVASAEADLNQVQQNYSARVAAAQAVVTDTEGRIDEAEAAIGSAQANVDNAQAKYNRTLDLFGRGFVAAQDVDDAKAAIEVARAQLKAAQARLASATAQRGAAVQQAAIADTGGKADIEAAKAKLAQAKAALASAQANSAQTSAYRQSLSALRSSVTAAEAALRSAEAKRADTVLLSPLEGKVTARYTDPGGIASPSQPILEVQFMRDLWATVAIPEELSGKVHIGQPASLKLDAYPGETFTASVIQVNPSADPQSRQVTVRAILDNRASKLKPGMFGRLALVTDEVKEGIAIPREALEQDAQGPYVLVVDSASKAVRRSVQIGLEGTDYIAIDEGLIPGEKVIILSARPVRDGQVVQIVGAGPPKSKGSDRRSPALRGGPSRLQGGG